MAVKTRLGKASNSNSPDGRESQAAGQVLFGKSGLGYIARRGVEFGTSLALQSLEGVMRMATQQPLELLSLLPELVPEVGLALWNGTMLGCGPDSLRFKATIQNSSGGSEEAPDGNAEIDKFWGSQPDEVGTLIDALGQNYQMMQFSGMSATEAVPGPRGTGLLAAYPVNTLTLRFKREEDGLLALYQRQTANPSGLGVYSAGFGGFYKPMPMDRFFYSKMSGLPDEPYGRAPLAPVLTIVIECLAFWRDVMMAFHRIGTPKWDVGFDFEMWERIARDVVGLTDDEEIDQYVTDKFNEAQTFFNSLKADDAFFHDIRSKVTATGAGDKWPDVAALWSLLRLRLMQALKTPPTLMGVVEGDTETWSRIQWDIFSTGLKTLVMKAAEPLRRSTQLHLQLLGMPYIVEAEYPEIQSITRLMDAQAEAQEILNEKSKVDGNWQLNDTAAQKITGSAPPTAEERAKDTPVKSTGTAPVGTAGANKLLNPADGTKALTAAEWRMVAMARYQDGIGA